MKPLSLQTSVALLALAFLLSACGPSQQTSPDKAQAKEPHEGAVATSEPAKTTAKNFLFVTDVIAEDPTGDPVAEISIVRPQRAMLRCNEIQIGRQYEATFRLLDGAGHQLCNKAGRFTPTETPWTVWCPFEPDYKVQKAGKWKWTVDVPGLGRYATEIGVLPPTPTELAELARHEKARESVFRAFAYYWLGHTNDYFTLVPQAEPSATRGATAADEDPVAKTRRQINQEVARGGREGAEALRQYKARKGEIEFQDPKTIDITKLAQDSPPPDLPDFGSRSRASQAKPQPTLPAKRQHEDTLLDVTMDNARMVGDDPAAVLRKSRPINVDAYVDYYHLLEVRGLTSSFSQNFVTEADTLNGINYRGTATFGFRLYRFFVPGKGWNDWQDVSRSPNEFFEALAQIIGSSDVPSELHDRLAVEFTIVERDGNWFVVANNQDRFANGKLVATGRPVNLAPTTAYARRILTTGTTPDRDTDRNLGKLARDNPQALENGIIATMSQLRGRTLQ